mmetsp:Transcript_25657/g.55175  ORF Transcript_25657/g.55175 Transcript_25657/m.55175 type:complete len:752 (+) Transcript_25657:95-2350(+)|eukprot:CAMPEP_0172310636 /NCGR_PEP_ID=MMETSP1058-20130122/12210_1 /TAXON_ID=83371 /ORGANISM="Detonula confervacea, Strain CCMP 353" /LENGTH=751 /DNA_ID=CAMNT_0013023529 /DNA_START=93 /DNA_END=2348 /DNA_ORIENTATION=+
MLRATPTLHKMASTHGGMRRILKKRLPVQKYIELAVKSGSYKSPSTRPNFLGLHDIPEPKGFISPREREERLKLARGIIDFPTEYEILSLNPPLPEPPRTPVRIRKKILADKRRHIQKLKKERKKKGLTDADIDDLPKELPSMDRLVKSYLRRHEDKLSSGTSPSQSRQKEEYYSQLLLGGQGDSGGTAKQQAQKKFLSPSSLQTAMGRKSMLVENAYAFALRQQQVLLQGDEKKESSNGVMSEHESVEKVEQLLREEARTDRQKGRKAAGEIDEWRSGQEAPADGEKKEEYDDSTLPSILHDRPRAIRALNIWSTRLQSIPYSRWTIGASTALDHWIAREVLQMDELAWQQVLEGGGTDAYVVDGEDTLQGGESKRGLMDRMRDIVLVRGALFPETQLGDGGGVGSGMELVGDLDANLLEGGGDNATEKSIDELLASLGELDDDDDGTSWKFDDEDEKKEEEEAHYGAADEKMASIMDELQVWRGRNASSPYEAWDVDRKTEFDQWIEKYVTTLYPEADASTVDKEATRNSLLSERPIDSNKTKEFWNNARTETEAELFLQDYRSSAQDRLNSLDEEYVLTKEGAKIQTELETILSVPFEVQLEKIVDMGTLRPILDDYAPGKERTSFLEKYAPMFLEGLEMEHLVPDRDGPIGLDDLSSDLRDELSGEWTPESGLAAVDGGQEPRFKIQMVAYGTDEFGSARAERARAMYQLWNEHKANRARFEESLFKKGYLGLKEDGVRIKKKKDRK